MAPLVLWLALSALAVAGVRASLLANCTNFTWPRAWPKNMTDLVPPPWARIDTSGGGTLDFVRLTNLTGGTVRFGGGGGPRQGAVSCAGGARIA